MEHESTRLAITLALIHFIFCAQKIQLAMDLLQSFTIHRVQGGLKFHKDLFSEVPYCNLARWMKSVVNCAARKNTVDRG